MADISLYETTAASDSTEELVVRHAGLVKKIAYHLLSRLPNSVQVEDLIQAGMIGLIEASQRYDAARMIDFVAYAGSRIRGSMIDELRRNSWLPRSAFQNLRRIAEAIRVVENATGRPAQAQEIAEVLAVNLEEYYAMSSAIYVCELFSIDDVAEENLQNDAGQDELYEQAQKDELKSVLVKAMSTLTEKEQLVLAFYYSEKLNFKEIGEVLGVGEARICQLHGQALARLKSRLRKEREE